MLRRLMLVAVVGLAVLGPIGCSQESREKTTTTTSTPGGKTTVTDEKKVQQSGDHPPAPENPEHSLGAARR